MERADLVIVQHEYGIYGGADGESVAALLEQVVDPDDRRGPHRAGPAHAPPA